MSNVPIKNRSDEDEDAELDTRHDFDDYFSYSKSDLIKKLILLQQENEELKSALKRALKSDKQSNYSILDKGQFKGYKIVREINEGGFGVVYEVEKEGKKYALKRLRENILDNCNIGGFKRECKKINKLHHPNVIKTFGIYLEGDESNPSFILEYCPQVLSKMVGNASVHGEEIVIWLFQIAEAMKYIHKNEMVHLDLKPSNILLDSEGFIKVSDFGIAAFMSPLERTTQLSAVTRFYAAPECLNFEEITEKFDVYSFGIIAFELLCGKLPIQEIKNIRVGKKFTFPSHFSSFARNLISQCCRFSPEERPSFEEILELFEENDYKLFNFQNDEVSKIKKFVVNHRKRIAKDSE